MQYFTVILALAAAVIATPTGTPSYACPGVPSATSSAAAPAKPTASAAPAPGPSDVCPDGLFSQAQCCATDVLGAVGLNCAVPATAVTSVDNFISTCSATGQQAKCCVIPVADQALLCQDVSPSA